MSRPPRHQGASRTPRPLDFSPLVRLHRRALRDHFDFRLVLIVLACIAGMICGTIYEFLR